MRVAVAVPASLAALGLAGWAVTHSSIFSAHRVEVAGAAHLTRAEVLRAGRVSAATNVMWTAPSSIEASLEANPRIADATVTRDLPSTLRIRITERVPASRVLVGSTWFLVSADGTVLGFANPRPHLPVLPNADRLTVGEPVPELATPAAVAGAMAPWLRARVHSVTPADDGTVQLGLHDGARVLFGSPTDVETKEQALAGILRWAARHDTRLATIDVRSPIAPAAVPVGG